MNDYRDSYDVEYHGEKACPVCGKKVWMRRNGLFERHQRVRKSEEPGRKKEVVEVSTCPGSNLSG